MPITLAWHDHTWQEIIVTFDGDWSWHDFYEAEINFRKWLYDVGKPTTLIIDARKAATPPFELHAHLLGITRNHHPLANKIIILRDTNCARRLVKLLKHRRPHLAPRFAQANSLEEALHIARHA